MCVIQIWRGKKREKGDIKKRGKAAGEMREWIMRGLTGRVAGTAERCDSTEEEWETDSGLICISNSPNIQPAMPETCWFALYSSSSVSSLSLSRSHFISISIFPDLMQVFFGGYFLSLLQIGLVFSVWFIRSPCVILSAHSPSLLILFNLSSPLIAFIFLFSHLFYFASCSAFAAGRVTLTSRISRHDRPSFIR